MKPTIISLLFIIFFAFALRFYSLSTIPPGIHGDEAEFGIRELLVNQSPLTNLFTIFDPHSLFNYSFLSFWIQGLFLKMFGATVFGIRASSAFAGVATVVCFFYLAKLLFKNIFLSLLITFAFATSHWHIAYSRLALNNSWTPLFIVLITYFFYKGILEKRKLDFIIAGVVLGLSLYFAQANRAFPLIVFLWSLGMLFNRKESFKTSLINIFLTFLLAGLVVSPLAYYYAKDMSIFSSRIETVSIFNNLPEYYARYNVDNVYEVILWQFTKTLKVFNIGGDIGFFFYGYTAGLLAPIAGVFAAVGLFLSLLKIKSTRHFVSIVWFFTIIVLGGVLTIDAPSSQRLLAVIPVLFLFIGITAEQLLRIKSHYIKILLVLLFVLNGLWDYKIYFIDYIHSQAGWAQKEPATQIAYYLKSLGPDWKVYMLRENTWLFFNHGTIRFLNPEIKGEDVDNSLDVIPNKEPTKKNIVYIMPHGSPSLHMLKNVYPKGQERFFFNPIGNTPSFISFEIKNTDLH